MTITPPTPSAAADRLDPTSTTLADDRFTVLADIRRESPVAFVPAIGMWAVTGHAEVKEVLADPQRFPSGGGYGLPRHLPAEARAVYDLDRPLWAYALIGTDGDLHRRLRSPLTAAFTARRVAQVEPLIAQDAAQLLDALFEDSETPDLFARFVRPLPSRTIARFFGLPLADAPRFSAWSGAFLTMQVPGLPTATYVAAATQFAEFDAYVRDLVTGDPGALGDGIVRTLLTGRRDGSHDLTEDELVGDIANVVFAGHETTVSTLSNVFVRLLRDRDLWDGLCAGSVDVTALREELLRLDTSVIGLFRTTATATRLGGVDLPGGVPLWVVYGAANRDPDVFDAPDAVAPGRPSIKQQMTFGYGRHVCIGAALVRAQLTLAITALPRAHPGLRLADDVAELPNHFNRTTPALPVVR
jgi:cytochrome P450